ncbi:hypothetical protein [Nonomuraea sp. NPDC050643]|uniref:hypothetical protein n=1 Tax=Nonomuraea sp. NPDC050643 TaxID=3155660 RepID=UPI00340A50EE
MGRHARPHSTRERAQEPQEASGAEEHPPSRGRHAKDRQRCATAAPNEQPESLSAS